MALVPSFLGVKTEDKEKHPTNIVCVATLGACSMKQAVITSQRINGERVSDQ
jgi:hypothetical protein